MRFSLIMATLHRTSEVGRFLKHLNQQTYRNFELIIIDQNPDNRLRPLIEVYEKNFLIKHLRSGPGISKARNVGLKHISGDIVAFPDDDCWYPQDLLRCVVDFFDKHPEIDIVTGRSIDSTGKPSAGHWDLKIGPVNCFNVWKRARSLSIFFRKKVIERVGKFDETLGLGAPTDCWAGEETDYLLRALKAGFRIYYDPNIIVYHPRLVVKNDPKQFVRAYRYGLGIGKVWRKHAYPSWFVFYQLFQSLIGALLPLTSRQIYEMKYRLAALRGKFHGWQRQVHR